MGSSPGGVIGGVSPPPVDIGGLGVGSAARIVRQPSASGPSWVPLSRGSTPQRDPLGFSPGGVIVGLPPAVEVMAGMGGGWPPESYASVLGRAPSFDGLAP